MSEFIFQPPSYDSELRDKFAKELGKVYPAIAQVLQGRTKEMKGGVFPPSTIMFSLDEGTLKVCVSPKYGAHVAFTTLDDPADLLGNLERQIKANKVDWRGRSKPK